jgi:flagella basal body P-ring formation protein FlgA
MSTSFVSLEFLFHNVKIRKKWSSFFFSRKNIAANEFDNKTTKNARIVLKKAQRKYLKSYSINAVLTDHDSQFLPINVIKKVLWNTSLSSTSKKHRIRPVLCSINHPQTSGKIEKFHDLYNKHQQV